MVTNHLLSGMILQGVESESTNRGWEFYENCPDARSDQLRLVMFLFVFFEGMKRNYPGRVSKNTTSSNPIFHYTLPKTKIKMSPENGPSQEETIVFQPSIFRGELLVAERGFTGHFETHPSFAKPRDKKLQQNFQVPNTWRRDVYLLRLFWRGSYLHISSLPEFCVGDFDCWLVVRNFVVDW